MYSLGDLYVVSHVFFARHFSSTLPVGVTRAAKAPLYARTIPPFRSFCRVTFSDSDPFHRLVLMLLLYHPIVGVDNPYLHGILRISVLVSFWRIS